MRVFFDFRVKKILKKKKKNLNLWYITKKKIYNLTPFIKYFYSVKKRSEKNIDSLQ